MEWISVKDKQPPKNVKFLGLNSENDMAITWKEDNHFIRGSWFGGCEYGCGGHDFFDNITHWMPLPKPPENK